MDNIGLIGGILAVSVCLWLLMSAAFLLLGARLAGIVKRSYGGALGIALLSGIASFVLGYALSSRPILGIVLAGLGGFLITALMMMLIFKTSLGKALGAAVLAWMFSSVIVGGTAMVAAIMLPAVNTALSHAEFVQTVSNGATIYRAVFASQMEDIVLGDNIPIFPKKGQYRTSTEYFIDLVEFGVLPVSYDFFAAPGIPGAHSPRAKDFLAENNAWRVVLGLDDAPEGTPFMFTRNYDPDSLQSGDGPIILNDEPPFGKKGMVVVLKGGAAYPLRGNQLRNRYFNPAGTPSSPDISIIGP